MTATRWKVTAVLLEIAAVILFIIGYKTWPQVEFNGLTLLACISALSGLGIALVKGD